MKNLAMLPIYFDNIFVHLRQKVRLMPESSTKFLSTLGPNLTEPELDPKSPARLTTLCTAIPILRIPFSSAIQRPTYWRLYSAVYCFTSLIQHKSFLNKSYQKL